MAENQFEVIKRELNQKYPAQGEILGVVLRELKPEQIEALQEKAADGKLALELEQLHKLNQFHAASADVAQFIETVRQLEFAQKGKFSSYKATGTYKTASGTTTVEAKKGCFVATAVYADEFHPNVMTLRGFRDNVLQHNAIGLRFINFYYKVGPALAESRLTKGLAGKLVRRMLDTFCVFLRK